MSELANRFHRALRVSTACAIAATLVVWLVAVTFALAGSRLNAEAVSQALTQVVAPLALALLVMFVVASLLVALLNGRR